MANANAPMGLIPRMHRNGTPYSGSTRVYYVPASDANAIGIGDPVVVTGAGDSVTGVPVVTLATAGATNYITGVMVGVSAASLTSQSLLPYRPASTAMFIEVCDDPDVVFEIQSNGTLASGDMSANADLASGSLNTASGLSGWVLDESTVGTGATKQLKIMRIVRRPDNALGTNGKVEVMINLHTQRYTTGF